MIDKYNEIAVLDIRTYEKTVDEEVKDSIGEEFIVSCEIQTTQQPYIVGNYTEEYTQDFGENIGQYEGVIQIPLGVERTITEMLYQQKVFGFSEKCSSSFIMVEDN